MSVELADEQDDPVPAGALRALAESALAAEEMAPETELGILLVGPERMAELHARYLGGSGPTDVLSLPIEDLTPGRPPRPSAGEPPLQVGDVVLCPAVIADRAAAAGVGFEEHMALLLVHGVLHLLGYHHGEDVAAERMEARERALLSAETAR